MPINFHIVSNHNLIVAFPTGVLTQSCVLDYFERVRADADYRLGLDRLIDNRNLTAIDFGYAEMRNIRANEIAVIARSPRRIRSVIVAANDVGYGMGRMYQSLAEANGDHDVAVVDRIEEALEFLGLDLAALEDIEHVSPT